MAILAGSLWGQARLTVDQLREFVQSSVRAKHPDKQVAAYLLKYKLSQRLDARTIEELQGLGAGPATMESLRKMVESSASLPAPPPKMEKPAPPVIEPPPIADQKAIIERVREYALNYSKSLPNFICTEVTRRYYDDTGQESWVNYDTLTTRLTYFEQKEKYELIMINNRSTTRNYHSLGGAISSGDFGSMMQEIFEPKSQAAFAWLRWGTLRGKRTHVYAYHVPQANSQWRIGDDHHDIIAAYKGLIYVDRDTEMILKLTLEAEDVPHTFPIQEAKDSLDYDYTKIGDQDYLLPLKGEVRMRHEKILTRNINEFHLYHKYGTDTEIKFENTPEAISDDKTKEEPPAK
jgi:hypothetical protein